MRRMHAVRFDITRNRLKSSTLVDETGLVVFLL